MATIKDRVRTKCMQKSKGINLTKILEYLNTVASKMSNITHGHEENTSLRLTNHKDRNY